MSKEAVCTFSGVCEFIKRRAKSKKNAGMLFERLALSWLRADPHWSAVLDRAWLWKDFAGLLRREAQPDAFDFRDRGVDIVAEARDGDLIAVQCKFHWAGSSLSRQEVDAFVFGCGRTFNFGGRKRGFSRGLWIHAGGSLGPGFRRMLDGMDIPVDVVSDADFEQSRVDWRSVLAELERAMPKRSILVPVPALPAERTRPEASETTIVVTLPPVLKPRSASLLIRLKPSTKAALQHLADQTKMPLATYCRLIFENIAQQEE